MKSQSTRWVVAVAALVWLAILVAITPPFLRALRCYDDWASGTVAAGEVIEAEPELGLVLQFEDGEACTVALGPASLEDFEPGEDVMAVRRADRPGRCELASTIEASQALLIALAAMVVVTLLLVVLIAIGFHRMLTQVPELTTHFDDVAAPVPCPRCEKPMEEGYLPLQAGVPWRKPGEPVGLVNAFRGLPGTVVGLRHRPRVHAYRCEPCEVVTFRYGR